MIPRKFYTIKRDPYRSDPQLNDIENAVENTDGDNFYVNPHHPDASDGNDGIFSELPLLTITEAVDRAVAYHGDRINIQTQNSWQYGTQTETGITETVVVPVAKPGLTIRGLGYGGLGTYWQPAAAADTILTIEALDTVVENICFWSGNFASAARGVLFDWDVATKGENGILRNCTFTDGVLVGVQLIYAYFCKILNCHFNKCGTYGIFLDAADSASEYLEIADNWFDDCGIAMALNKSTGSKVHRNHIFNTAAQNGAAATNKGIYTTAGAKNLITQNFFSCLLPVPANGDWNDLNSAAATDAWINNFCMNGVAVTNPT